MSQRITLQDDEYWKLQELKVRFKTESLIEIFAKLEQTSTGQDIKPANRFIQITEKATAALQADKPTGTESEQKQE